MTQYFWPRFDEHGPAEDQRPAALVVAEQQFLHRHPAFCRCGLPHKPRVLPVRRAGSGTSRGCRVALAGGHIDGSDRTAPPAPAMRTTTATAALPLPLPSVQDAKTRTYMNDSGFSVWKCSRACWSSSGAGAVTPMGRVLPAGIGGLRQDR